MEKFYSKKTIRAGIVSAIMLLIVGMMIPVFFIKGSQGYSLLDYVLSGSDSSFFASLSIVILLSILALMAIATIVIVWVLDKGQLPTCISGFIIGIISIILGASQGLLSAGSIVFLIFVTIFSALGIAYSIIGLKYRDKSKVGINKDEKARFLPVLIINIIATFGLLLFFFIPVLTYQNEGVPVTDVILIGGLTGTSDPLTFVGFVACVALMIVACIFLYQTLTSFFYHDMGFVNYSKRSMYFCYISSVGFFVAGVTSVFIYSLDGAEIAKTNAYIPFILYSVLMIAHSLLNGRNSALLEKKSKKTINWKYRVVLFSFVALFTLVTYITLALPFLKVDYMDAAGQSVESSISVTGFDLLKKTIGPEFSSASFFAFAIVLLSGIIFAFSLVSFLTRSPELKRFAYAAVVMNFAFVLIIGLFGKYYEVSEKINVSLLEEYIKNLSKKEGINVAISLSDAYTSKIDSSCFVMIFVDTALAIAMLIVKPISRYGLDSEGELSLVGGEKPIEVKTVPSEMDPDKKSQKETPKESMEDKQEKKNLFADFDACPAFSEIDEMQGEFDVKMKERRNNLFKNPSLPSLTQFIVDYARESRLHLSYQLEDIASFIAGLASTKLSILQGMSGTGKTSLPKIFLEALEGNCEIVEVESSWKDKNELLGYYNEFSKTFTPKKFTRALYKASLNPEVITFIVLDEMNLSRIEYYFSDFLSLMENEPDKREIQLLNVKLYHTYDGVKHPYKALDKDHTLHIPENVWFIGTANRDESTFEISDKVYDRAHTMNFNKRAPKVRNFSVEMEQRYLPYETLNQLFVDALSKSNFDLEEIPYLKNLEDVLRPYNISFGNRILNQIETYVRIYSACFNSSKEATSDALEDILLSKVVAKLEFKTIEDKDELAHKFEKMNLFKCAEFIHNLNEDI